MHWKKHLYWIVPLLLLDTACLTVYLRWVQTRPAPAPVAGEMELETQPPPAPVSQLRALAFPIRRAGPLEPGALDPETPGIFQPTASGRPESALYGSTRTGRRGKYLRATFHEGVDLAAGRRDRRGRPLDEIIAIADGQTAYINRIAGNSNYGKYVVLKHADPLGEIYSLYAHLAEIPSGVRAGRPVKAGQTIGRMGHTSSSPIPMPLAHLHLEIGLILNSRFRAWYRGQKLIPDHGNFHGWNLLGIDPLRVFAAQRQTPDFNLQCHLAKITPAFEAVMRTAALPDYFQRYAGLWHGAAFAPPAFTIVCSENGVPLAGRNADAGELAALGGRTGMVQNVNLAALGRNGARLIYQTDGRWELSQAGEKWRAMLLHR